MCSEKQQAEIVGYGKWKQSDKILELCICGLWSEAFIRRLYFPYLPVYLLCMMMQATVAVKRVMNSFYKEP